MKYKDNSFTDISVEITCKTAATKVDAQSCKNEPAEISEDGQVVLVCGIRV